ncbi:methyltransferase family protein [Yoonia maritima]|uniref:methyltransferase family protein n=1 Tax=Yoonia maritima TaxID=1435347 RepID=UPI000D111998|nr:methyltransferase [Yoonia maritima]
MINLSLPESWMLALRWLLLLGPVCLALVMVRLRHLTHRAQIAGLFAFLYGVAMVFVTHSFAVWMGWWHYGWDALMVNALPADIILGGAILFGPGLYFSFPKTRPLMICLPIILGLHGTIFSSLEPLVFAGHHWFLGVLFVFATAHLPAIYLAKWTEADTHLSYRCTLLAIMTGGMIFALLPSLIMLAMGGTWDIFVKPVWMTCLVMFALSVSSLIGLSANQTLCLQGGGTPIPLDPTIRLVTTGLYAYVSNPMQLSAALGWVILGLFLQNIWIMAASLMAWVFVQGMVRWHHRHDLLKRFPTGWPEYKKNVPEWIPRWQPWTTTAATLTLSDASRSHHWVASRLGAIDSLDVQWSDHRTACYDNPDNVYGFRGTCAIAAAFVHVNFAYALLGQAWLLIAVPCSFLFKQVLRRAI